MTAQREEKVRHVSPFLLTQRLGSVARCHWLRSFLASPQSGEMAQPGIGPARMHARRQARQVSPPYSSTTAAPSYGTCPGSPILTYSHLFINHARRWTGKKSTC